MIGLIMAGGKGTRMGAEKEKLLLQYEKPIIIHVIEALKNSGCFSKTIVATSDNSPNTQKLVQNYDVDTVKTKGDGYVADLNDVLLHLSEPAFVASGDMPLLDGKIILELVARYDGSAWQSFLVTKEFLDSMGMRLEFSVNADGEECYYTGLSIVDPKQVSSTEVIKETYQIVDDKRLALNLNTKRDYELIKRT